jgi:hypothetical chaperone protein
MHAFCGLDFGTSNSTMGALVNNSCQLLPLEKNSKTIRSAIFCNAESKQWVFGQEGINCYLESIPGRLMMALKSVLGSSLMEEETLIFNEFISYTDVLSMFLRHIKSRAEQFIGHELSHAVLGRPVHFHDSDAEKDRAAENTLAGIAHRLGFKEVTFQYEPIAAALTYETTLSAEKLALIIDMGGGTSDFTVIRLRPGKVSTDRSNDVLANAGIHLAGTDFDHKLSLHAVMPLLGMGSLMRGSSSDIEVPSTYYHDLTTWHTLTNLYNAKTISHVRSIQARAYEKDLLERLIKVMQHRAGHHILDTVEHGKQQLSDLSQVTLNLDFIEPELATRVTRSGFNQIIHDEIERITTTILQTVTLAGVKPTDINAIFYTGGSTKIPVIHERINPLFSHADIVQGDVFGSVGLGLTLDAQRRYC